MSIGQSRYRDDAPGKVTGAALYPGDIRAANALYGKVVFSGQPHARLTALDTNAAAAVPGVVLILTAADVPNNEYGLVMPDQPVLVGPGSNNRHGDVSRWEGDQIAFVIAESEAAAVQAADRLAPEWEPLPLVADPEEALKNETLLHPDHKSNTVVHYKFRKGDMNAGWAAADVVVSGTYHFPRQEHAYLQPEAGLGYVDDAGRITVEVAGQWLHEDQLQIMHALNLPADKVRIKYAAIGGAFGGREDMSIQIVLALAAMKLKAMGIHRPVRTTWSREESIVGHHKRHGGYVETRWGADRAGRITAMKTRLVLDAGAYNYTSNKVLGNAHLCVVGPYQIENAYVDSYAVYTNNVPGGAFRGFGAPQGAFVAESQLNKLAAALNIDPVELRRRNVLQEGMASVTQTPLPAGNSLPQVIEQCAQHAGWDKPLAPARAASSFASLPAPIGVIRRGRGFACAFKNIGYSFGFPERSEATIELHGGRSIEKVIVRAGGADVGQGAHTAFRQMAAEATGMPLDKVEIRTADTAEAGDSGSASASRLTWMTGNAVRQAAEKAIEAWNNEDRPAIGAVRFTPPPTEPYEAETGRTNPNFTYGYVAEVAEVSVDSETGHIRVDRLVCANDVGKAINPNLVEGQIEGAVVQAHGYAVTENLQVKEGRILNPRFSTYLIPGISDIPEVVKSVILEYPDPRGPWGARGMAEMPFIPYAPAVVAAIYDATGVWLDEFPLTPARVRAALKANEA